MGHVHGVAATANADDVSVIIKILKTQGQAKVKLHTFFMELQKVKQSLNPIQIHILLLLAVLYLDQHFY